MPITGQITSKRTGQTYAVTFERPPNEQDIDEAAAHLDKPTWDAHGVDPSVGDQGPVGTALMSVPQTFAKVGTGTVGGISRILDKGTQIVGDLTGSKPSGFFGDVANATDELAGEAERTFPTNPLNAKAGAIGSGVAQAASLLAGGVAGKMAGLGNAALRAVPLVSAGLSGTNEGVKKAEEIGVQSPQGQLAMGLLFGGVEAGTEMMFGVGSKAGTRALMERWKKPAAEVLKKAAKSIAGEGTEEIVAGSAQDLLTRAFAMEDPNKPGYTTTGVELPKMDRKMLEQRGLEALGGAAGGAIFAGAQTLNNYAAPVAPQVVPGQPLVRTFTRSDGQQFHLRFAQEPTEQDLIEAQQHLEGQTTHGNVSPNQATAAAAPTAGNGAANATAAGSGVAGGNPFAGPITAPPQRDEAGNVVGTGPQGVPGFRDDPFGTVVPQPAGGNVLVDYGIPRTPDAQAAYEQRQQAYAQSQATARGQMNQAGGRMPMIPDNPLGYRDILDFVNDNPLHIPIKGSEAAKAGEYDWTQQYEMPKYYRRFLASSDGGHSADALAQMAHDEGYIHSPTPDALMEQIQKTIRERTQHRVEFRRQQQVQNDEARRLTNFDKAQQKASPVESQALPLHAVVPGDEFTLAGENVRVKHVEHDEDGNATLVQIEDGKKFGILNLDPQTRGAILVDEFRPRGHQSGDAPIPLGMMRPAREDQLLRSLSDADFHQERKRAEAKVGEWEDKFDANPDLADKPDFRRQMALHQDAYTATLLEKFRRDNKNKFVGDLVVDFAKLAADLGQPNATEAQSENGAKLRILHEIITGQNFTDADVREGFSYTNGSLSRSRDFAEVTGYRAKAAKAWAEWLQSNDHEGGAVPPIDADPFMRAPKNLTRGAQSGLAAASAAMKGQPVGGEMVTQRAEPDTLKREQRTPEPDTVNREQRTSVTPALLAAAHEKAVVGSSTPMVTIKRVFEEAQKLQPGIELPQFLEALHKADNSGKAYLEVYDKPHELTAAGEHVLRNASGIPAVRMMMAPQEEGDLAMPANLQRPAVRGPLPSSYSGAAVPALGAPAQPWSGRVQTLMGIRKFLLNAVGLPAVGVGRFKRALGIYRIKPQSVRLQAINDIPVLAHEIGHALHYRVLSDTPGRATDWQGRFDAELLPMGAATSLPTYTQAMVRKEGVAEFVRQWLTNPIQARAQAPQFAAFFEAEMMRRNPAMAAALQQAQAMVADYVAMPEFAKAQAQIAWDPEMERTPTTWGQWARTAYAKWVDTLSPALRVVHQAAMLEPTLEQSARHVEALMENHRGGVESRAHADVLGHQTDLEGNRIGPGLSTILAALQPGENQEFSTYIALKRAKEIEAQGKRSGFENAHPPAAEMRVLEARFEATRLKLLKYLDNQLQLLVDGGVLDAPSAAAMRQANRDYVPFYRLYEKLNGVSFGGEGGQGGGFVDLNSGIRRLKGSDRTVVDPLQSVMKNAFVFRKLAEQNRIGVQFFDLIKGVHGHGQWGEEIQQRMTSLTVGHAEVVKALVREGIIQSAADLPVNADLTLRLFEAMQRPDTKNGEVIIFRQGKGEHWEVKDPLLLEALKTADADAVRLTKFFGPLMTKLLTLPTRVLRFGATGGPWFAVPNFIRDQFTAGLQSKSGYVPFWDGIKGAAHVMGKTDVYQRWIEAGGKYHGITSSEGAYRDLLQDALPKEPGVMAQIHLLADPRSYIKALGWAGQVLEEATRVQEYNRMMQQGHNSLEAANASKKVSMNFARAGERGRALNMLVAFANAQIQQLDMVVNGHRDPKRRAQTVMRGVMMVTVPSVLCWLLGKDDDEIQALPEWRKNLFWNLNLGPVAKVLGRPGFILSVPKPFLMGAIYGTSVERMLDYASDRDPNGWKKALSAVLDQTIAPLDMAMSIAGLRPIAEAAMNKDFYKDRPVVPEQMQAMPASQQYDQNTSQTARLMGRATGQSPMMIDHLIRGYFATAGKWGTDAIDFGMEKLGVADVPPPPRRDVMEWPILNKFADKPYAANVFVDRFYKAQQDMEGVMKVWNKQTDSMTSAEQKRWWQKYGAEIQEYSRTVNAKTGRTGAGDIRAAMKTLSEIGGAMKEIQGSHVLKPEIKRARLLELAQQRNKAAEWAFKNLFPAAVKQRHW